MFVHHIRFLKYTHIQSFTLAPINCHPMITRTKGAALKNHPITSTYLTNFATLEPRSVKPAMSDSKWLKAIEEGFHALQSNNTWTLVPPLASSICDSTIASEICSQNPWLSQPLLYFLGL
ncbi:hypothetical protein ACOSP7_031884 [Xanthoceras sorbifolium]